MITKMRISFCVAAVLAVASFCGVAEAQSPSKATVAASPKGAESVSLRFEQTSHHFGTIAEDGGEVSHTFRFTNIRTQPVVIVNAVSSCGCTRAEYSRKPIKAGEAGEVVVIFNPMNYPGAFARRITLYTSEGRMAEPLAISGNVTPRERSIEERYPIVVGEGVRMEANAHAFGYVEHGNVAWSAIGIVNDSEREVSLQILPTTASGWLDMRAPQRLKPQAEAQINFGYTLADECEAYGTLHDVLEIEVNGMRSPYPLIIDAIAIDNRDNLADGGTPKAELSDNFIKFGALKYGDREACRIINICNTGSAPLHLRRVESDYGRVSLALDSKTVDAGRCATLSITLLPTADMFGAVTDRVRITTDDSRMPMRTIKVSALIERE